MGGLLGELSASIRFMPTLGQAIVWGEFREKGFVKGFSEA
jgi:hypothetical protein